VVSGTDAAGASQIDLIAMDVSMPVMDGFAAGRAIRADVAAQGLRRCPVIAVTGNALDKDRASTHDVGMDDLLSKPVRPDDLLACAPRHLAAAPKGADRRSA